MTCKYSILLLVGYFIFVQGDGFYASHLITYNPQLTLRSLFDEPNRGPAAAAAPAPTSRQLVGNSQIQPAARRPIAQDQVVRRTAAVPAAAGVVPLPPSALAANDLQRPVGELTPAQRQWNGQAAPKQLAATTPDYVHVQGLDESGSGSGPPLPTVSASPTRPPAQFNYMERFSSKLFQPIANRAQQRNMVYSPASVHSMLAMLYIVSHGQTFNELQQGGEFSDNTQLVAIDFQNLLTMQKQLQNAELILASRVLYNPALGKPNYDFPQYAKTYFGADIETLNVQDPRRSASKINAWVSDRTKGKIQQLISASDIDDQTQAIILNAIYFKARWANEFSTRDTMVAKFRMLNGATMNVAMMYNDDVFDYAQLPSLDATALEMPYAGTQMSMLIILPNQVNGLTQLERRLAQPENDLNAIAAQLRRETVTVRIPKFQIEFEQDMSGPLQQIGIKEMFTSNSRVDAMLDKRAQVSKLQQKAFIDVNEAGSEAAASSYAKFVPLSLPIKSHEFTADHPFIFAIRSPTAVLFIGHVVQPTQAA